MSEYPKTTEVTEIVEREIEDATGDFHTHANKATLDRLTTELMQELDGLQQFEDSTNYDIHDIREALLPISSAAHTHNNKDMLDTITEQYMRDEAAFHAPTADALHGLSTGLSEVSAQAHFHTNKSVLDNITQEMLDDMASIATVVGQAHWHHNLTTLNGITDSHVSRWNEAYTAAMNLNERVGVNEGVFERFKTEILYDMQGCRTSISDILTRLSVVEEMLSGVEEALADIVEVTLFRNGDDALTTYGESIYTFYIDGYRSIAGFADVYPHFCCAENDYALYYNQPDFNCGAVIYTMCITLVRITPANRILLTYKSGSTDAGEMWLVRKSAQQLSPAETARYIHEKVSGGEAISIPFGWLGSVGNYISVLHDCSGVSADEYYLAWKAVTDNTSPMIRTVKVLEVTT